MTRVVWQNQFKFILNMETLTEGEEGSVQLTSSLR